jgi:hypothetical protein
LQIRGSMLQRHSGARKARARNLFLHEADLKYRVRKKTDVVHIEHAARWIPGSRIARPGMTRERELRHSGTTGKIALHTDPKSVA